MNLKVDEILEYTSNAVLSLDHDLRIMLFNPAAEKLFGYKKEEILGQPMEILLPMKFRDNHPQQVKSFRLAPEMARQMSSRSQVKGLTKTGRIVPLDISIQKHPAGSDTQFTAMCRDVSREVAISDELFFSEARLARAQSIAHLGNWVWNISTGALSWSDEIYRIFGREPQEFEATYDAFLETIHPDDRARVSDAVNESVADDVPYAVIHRIICPDGAEKVVQEIGEVLRNDAGEAIRMDGTVQDITLAWHTGEDLRKASRTAREAEHTKSQFMSIMSHELKTPMTAILGFADLINLEATSSQNAEYQTYARGIKKSGQSLLSMINDVLEYSDMGSNSKSFNPSFFEASSLIEETQKLIQEALDEKHIKITTMIAEDLPALYLDPLQCRQILFNLLSNAVKFSAEDSTVTISIEQANGEIVMSIADQGIGMSEKQIGFIFNPFLQGDMELTRPYAGIGLGLAIVQTLMNLHDGRIEVESSLEEGSTFRIFFPLIAEANAAESA